MEHFNSNEISCELEEVAVNTNTLPDFDQELIEFCSVTSSHDNTPKKHILSLSTLVSRLSAHPERAKKDGPAIIPAVFKDGEKRASANVERMTALVLDVDDGTPFEALYPLVEPFAHVYHTSHSHSPEHPKYRIIIFLAKPIPVAQWASFWLRAAQYFKHMDPATKDPARLYYTPAHPPGAKFETRFNPGVLLTTEHLSEGSTGDAEQPELATSDARAPETREQPCDESKGDLKPAGGLIAVVNRCAFMKCASAPENQSQLSEPIWMAMMTNACGFEDSDGWIHEASKHHESYDEADTQSRIDRYRGKYTPVSCARIRQLGFKGCPEGGCKTKRMEVVKAPAGLWGWIQSSDVTPGAEKVGDEKKKKSVEQIYQEQVRQLAYDLFGGNIAFCLSRIMVYGDGFWSPIEENLGLNKPIFEAMGVYAGVKKVKKAVAMMKIMFASSEEYFNRGSNLICLKNGTLDPTERKLLPHSPRHYLSNQVELDFDPSATCPLWLQTLDEIFAPDADKDEKIRLLQEFIGYCLVADTSFHKFLWLVGGGGNGKSLVLSVLVALLGRANVSSAHIERLENAFVRAELQGKLVNISSEMSADATIADGYLKQIVAGDIIEAERKYEPSFSFKPYARLIAATNTLPRLRDHSDGFFRRAIILRFNRQFLEHEQDKQRETRLMAELPGILNWALAGRTALYERGNFLIPTSSKVEVSQYRVDSDPVQQFSDEEVISDPEGKEKFASAKVYAHYKEWCTNNGYRALAINSFAKRMEALGFKKGRDNKGRYWELTLPNFSDPWGPQIVERPLSDAEKEKLEIARKEELEMASRYQV